MKALDKQTHCIINPSRGLFCWLMIIQVKDNAASASKLLIRNKQFLGA